MKNMKLFWRMSGFFLISALFFAFGGGSLRAEDTFKKVSAATELVAGDEVIIVAGTSAFNGEITTSNPWAKYVTVTVTDNAISTSVGTSSSDYSAPRSFIVEFDESGNLSLRDKQSDQYLQGSSSSNTISYTASSVKVTLTTDGIHDVTVNKNMRLNSSSGFRFYSGNSTGTATVLYKKKAPAGPFVSTSQEEVSYKILPTANLNEKLSFTAGNLTSALAVSVASATEGKSAVISVDKSTVEQSAESFDLTLTTSGLAEGEYKDIITIKMGETPLSTVTVNLKVEMNYPYKKITTADELTDGAYLIVYKDEKVSKAAGAMEGTNKYITAIDVVISEDEEIDEEGKKTAHEFYLESTSGGWSIKDVEKDQYLKTTGSTNTSLAYDGSAFDWTITVADGVYTVTSSGSGHGPLQYNTGAPRFTNYTGSTQKNLLLYKKQVPEVPTCEKVTLPSDGAVTPHPTTADIIWVAPQKGETVSSYEVTVTGEEYNETQTVTEGTEIEWTGLTAEKQYKCSIVSVCGTDFKSDPVEITFTTLAEAAPVLNINTPAQGAVFTGDVTFTFTTTNFELGDDKLVKATVKEQAQDQVNALILKTFYTKTSSVTITGLEDGLYHVDLYMVEVKPKTEGTGNDTAVVGFNGDYVHRNIEVKHPAVYFSAKNLKITTYRGVEASGKVKVTGWALPDGSSVSFASDNANVTVTPNSFAKADVMAEGGAELTVKYNGADAAATATITATCGAITATLAVNAIAKDTLSNLKAVYSRAAGDSVLVRGKMVVTHKDSARNSYRVWVQDIEKENGASMLLYSATSDKGYSDLKVGDVLQNVAGKVTLYSETLYELTLNEKLVATEHGHAVYVDTLSLDEVKANNTNAKAQSALVCIKDVQFKETGNFESGKSYTLQQGEKELTFRTDYAKADYIGKPISASRLYVTAIVGSYKGAAQVTARSLADMVTAPCLVPANIIVEEVHSNEAILDWDGWADNYSLRYGTEENLESVTPVEVNGTHATIDNLNAQTTYYYQIKSVCGADGYESEWSAVKSFTTVAANLPTIRMTSPALNTPTFTDSVLVSFSVRNVTLKANDTLARIVFSDGFTTTTTDTAYKRALPSGNYSVRVELIKNGEPLESPVTTASRAFKVDLPDVAEPVFTPVAGRYADSVEVTLACATEEATIFYAQGEGEYVAYTAGEKILIKETAELKAFACKERMDTSAVVRAAYTITKSVAIEGEIVFEEYFDKVANGVSQITGSLDDNTTLPGWTGDFVYQHTGGGVVRLGKSISNGAGAGWIETPAINLSENNGKFMVSFYAQAWKNDKDSIRVVVGNQSAIIEGLVNDKESNQTRITDMTHYVVTFENGTAETKIKFEPLSTTTNNRFFLDSIRVYQVLPNVPRLSASPAMFEMNTVQGTPASQKVTVKGNLLSEDVTVTLLQTNENFSASATTLAKNDVMSANGAELTVTFNASVAEDSVKIELTSGELSQTVKVRAYATPIVEVDNIAALRAGEQNTLYKVKGEVVVTAVDGISTWVQDATAAIQIYGNPGNTYAVGDGITGIYGTLSDYHGLIELVPGGTQPAATTHDKVMDPEVMTVEELNEKGAEYSSRLIRINDLMLGATEGNWKGSTSYTATDEAGNELVIYTTISQGSYIGEALPTGKFDLIAIAGIRDGKIQVTPRVKEDIIAGEVDPCAAPTRLKAVVVDKNATLTWEGAAEQYRVVVTLGEKEIRNDLVSEKTYALSNLEVGTYAWKVASVCEGGEEWANGENFEVKPVANDDAEELAFRIYPNPTTGVFYVEVAEGANMEIFTLGGVMVRNEMLKAGRNEVRLDRSGIYFVRLTNANGAAVNRVIVR